jgi:hypothetical protein
LTGLDGETADFFGTESAVFDRPWPMWFKSPQGAQQADIAVQIFGGATVTRVD